MLRRLRPRYPSSFQMAFRLFLWDNRLAFADRKKSWRAFLRQIRGFFSFPFNRARRSSIMDSLLKRASFNIFRSVGKVISAGEQVASRINFSEFFGGSSSSSFSTFDRDGCFIFSLILPPMISLTKAKTIKGIAFLVSWILCQRRGLG